MSKRETVQPEKLHKVDLPPPDDLKPGALPQDAVRKQLRIFESTGGNDFQGDIDNVAV